MIMCHVGSFLSQGPNTHHAHIDPPAAVRPKWSLQTLLATPLPGYCRHSQLSTVLLPLHHAPPRRSTRCFMMPRDASYTSAASATRCLLRGAHPGRGPLGVDMELPWTSHNCRCGCTLTVRVLFHPRIIQANVPAWLPDVLKTAMGTYRDSQQHAQGRAHPIDHASRPALAATVRECLQHMVTGAAAIWDPLVAAQTSSTAQRWYTRCSR